MGSNLSVSTFFYFVSPFFGGVVLIRLSLDRRLVNPFTSSPTD